LRNIDARKIHNVNIGPVVTSKTALNQTLIVTKAMLSFQAVKKENNYKNKHLCRGFSQ
jgi:hypothetical protein